jgi:spore maturation protein CgeB
VAVHGDPGWQALTAEAMPDVHYERDAAAFYRSRTINLNSTSVQMPTAVNQRVFDVPAAGGFLLTDAQSDLRDLFDGESELATYDAPAHCAELVKQYQADQPARLAIAAAARRRIQAEHTYHHRLLTIAALAQSLWVRIHHEH